MKNQYVFRCHNTSGRFLEKEPKEGKHSTTRVMKGLGKHISVFRIN
jgi:hypothetical protein